MTEFNVTTETCNLTFDDDQNDALVGMTLFGAVLSMLGSTFIVVSYYAFPSLKTFPFHLIMLLSVSDWFNSFSYFIGVAGDSANDAPCDNSGRCIFAAIMNQFFGISSFMWTSIVAFNCYAVLVQQKGRAVEANARYYHAASWGVALLLTLSAGAASAFGDAGNWCWIKQSKELARFFCYYLPLLFAMGYIFVVFILISRAVKGSAQRDTINFRLRLYLFVFVFIHFFSIMNRMHEFAANEEIYALFMLQSIFAPLQGLFNAVVYGFNQSVVNVWSKWYQTHFGRGRSADADDGESGGAIAGHSGDETPPVEVKV